MDGTLKHVWNSREPLLDPSWTRQKQKATANVPLYGILSPIFGLSPPCAEPHRSAQPTHRNQSYDSLRVSCLLSRIPGSNSERKTLMTDGLPQRDDSNSRGPFRRRLRPQSGLRLDRIEELRSFLQTNWYELEGPDFATWLCDDSDGTKFS
jgi:hypothetical protein